MLSITSNLCVIPARGGSNRIPCKNIRDFCGKPMIAWPIIAAQESGLFDHIIVSTDDDEIAAVAEAQGAEVPFRRPAELSDDHAGTTAVIAHAVRWVQGAGWTLDAVCCLYATAPFVRAADIRACLEQLQTGQWAYCFTATRFASPILVRRHQRHAGAKTRRARRLRRGTARLAASTFAPRRRTPGPLTRCHRRL